MLSASVQVSMKPNRSYNVCILKPFTDISSSRIGEPLSREAKTTCRKEPLHICPFSERFGISAKKMNVLVLAIVGTWDNDGPARRLS